LKTGAIVVLLGNGFGNETWRDGWAGRFIVTCTFETREATGGGDRLAHDPEVAGQRPGRDPQPLSELRLAGVDGLYAVLL
jgi:hypothetical protein